MGLWSEGAKEKILLPQDKKGIRGFFTSSSSGPLPPLAFHNRAQAQAREGSFDSCIITRLWKAFDFGTLTL